ncbi:MAG: hypothetical protein IJP29_03190 [Lachnospiraceae bacterium]|nr:hypothetical protein [Lachnospiraceae bacterium]
MQRQCTAEEKNILLRNEQQIINEKPIKDFFDGDNLVINGATIVEVDAGKFSYIEDDRRTESGNYIIIDNPENTSDMTQSNVGDRILVVYNEDFHFQLMKLNEELKGLVSEEGVNCTSEQELSQCMRVPHPNVLRIKKDVHELTDKEREEYAELHLAVRRSITSKGMKYCFIAMVVIAVILCVALNFVEGGYPFSQTVPIAVAVCGGIGLFSLLAFPIGNVNIKRQGQFKDVKEVVYRCSSERNNDVTEYVYEWIDGELLICEYPYCEIWSGTQFGDVLYKFTNMKGEPVLQNIKPVNQKK